MKVIRGAICAENSVESISRNAVTLVKEIMSKNSLAPQEVESVFFSTTADLNACYPATAVRTQLLPNASFMCFQEMQVVGSMQKVIRVAVFADISVEPKHCYLGETSQLRTDLNC